MPARFSREASRISTWMRTSRGPPSTVILEIRLPVIAFQALGQAQHPGQNAALSFFAPG